jgi:hypothetical protein
VPYSTGAHRTTVAEAKAVATLLSGALGTPNMRTPQEHRSVGSETLGPRRRVPPSISSGSGSQRPSPRVSQRARSPKSATRLGSRRDM